MFIPNKVTNMALTIDCSIDCAKKNETIRFFGVIRGGEEMMMMMTVHLHYLAALLFRNNNNNTRRPL